VKYSEERQESVLAKLCPPNNRSIREVAAEEGISEATLYIWRRKARQRGELYPDAGSEAEGWNARDKFAAVVETAAMNESERSEYCRKRGLYPEQLAVWRRACEQANDWAAERGSQQVKADRDQRRKMRELERDLARKEKALAETAALLTLSKKARAIWGDGEDE
jgi:transposase-like protein